MKNRAAFRKKIGDWYLRHGRALPWRERPTLYGTVVSEFMCQQTRVETATPYFLRWMEALPNFSALANAKEGEVLKLWEGLGYYQRARNLHRLAGILSKLEEIPTTAAAWEKYPGVGRYTAAAITSISFGTAAACVDGNVVRLLARIENVEKVFKNNGDAVGFFRESADRLLDHSEPGQHNQAMMELGATLCVKAAPRCGDCPVSAFCLAHKAGNQDDLPRFQSQKISAASVDRLWMIKDNSLLLGQIPANGARLASLYELPVIGDILPAGAEKVLIKKAKRSISNQRITENIFSTRSRGKLLSRIDQKKQLRWIPLSQLDGVALSGPHRRWIRELLG